MSILVLEKKDYSSKAIEIYKKIDEVIFFDRKIDSTKIKIIVCRLSYNLSSKFLREFKNLKYILSPTTGLNHIDLDYCKKKKIKIISFNTSKKLIRNISSTAELNFGLIIQLVRNLHESINSTIKTKKFHRDKFKGIELKNKVLGIIGFGRIGRKIYKYAKAFGMKILINDKKKLIISSQVSLSNLLKKSDIISINADTSNLIINKKNIKLLKHNCYIVNTSRGELVDEQAIYNALIKKKISGYATDVLDFYYESNNISKSYIFRAYKKKLNVVITPHIGGCTYEAMHLTEVILAKYFLKIIKKNYG
tara:strand:- start:6382 stop:7302 length:921 start_codon:yes stop_codon:yes gene_type:complete